MSAYRFLSMFAAGLVLTAGLAWGDQPRLHQPGTHIEASGVVTKVTPTSITLKTPFADVILSVNASERSGFTHVNTGDELTVWLNEDNVVVDVHKKGDRPQHRLISGKLAFSDQTKTQLKLWTPEGIKTFPIKSEETRLQRLPEGTPVTIELDEQGRLLDIHKN